MDTAGDRQNILGLPQGGLEAFVAGLGEKPFRARQLMQWMHGRGVADFAAMTDLSKSLRARLDETAVIATPTVTEEQTSADGTIKWLYLSGRGQAVEAVFIPEPGRGTLCISSQVGCALDCAWPRRSCGAAARGSRAAPGPRSPPQ